MDSGNSPANSSLRKTALNALHKRLGAKMVNFGGWDMPVEYPCSGNLMCEHRAVRGGVGVFDVSHMGDIRIRGKSAGGKSTVDSSQLLVSEGNNPRAQAGVPVPQMQDAKHGGLAAVQHLCMNDASKLAIGQAHYSAMLYPSGTFVDDVIVHRLGEDDYLLVINAGTREKDISWVRENTKGMDCQVEELSDAYTQVAIQGPRAAEVLQKLTDAKLETVKNYWFTHGTVCGLPNTLIARTGYTGEDGFEIYVPSDVATSERVWNEVFGAGKEFGIVACGLGARNTLRLESKMALYGHEISDTINVWEAGLERYCHLEKGAFVGRDALVKLRAEGLKRALVGLEMVERGIARDGYRCLDEAGNAIGVVTSGSPSPTLGKNIALAYVPPSMTGLGTAIFVEIRGQKVKAVVVATPFYKRVRTPRAQAGMPVPR